MLLTGEISSDKARDVIIVKYESVVIHIITSQIILFLCGGSVKL